jgi:hypothetical protein
MIRFNQATELCITNGQQGHVAGWTSTTDNDGHEILEVVFVKLYKPAKDIKIPGLEENIVPISRKDTSVKVGCPNGEALTITRSQVPLVLNFGMTDYNSQGRTLDYNLVNFQSAYKFQGIYTSLSRSSSHKGTLIMQSLSPDVINLITEGLHGRKEGNNFLRQEYRELELLDDISRLRYENELPDRVKGTTRNHLIFSYRQWKGEEFVPESVPINLRWSENDPFIVPEKADGALLEWGKFIIENNNVNKAVENEQIKKIGGKAPSKKNSVLYTTALGTSPLSSLKRKKNIEQEEEATGPPKKKKRRLTVHNTQIGPVGLIWDAQNYSCAYDSLLTIFFDIWLYDPQKWTAHFKNINRYMSFVSAGFKDVTGQKTQLENIRDIFRRELHTKYGDPEFPYGQKGTNLAILLQYCLTPEHIPTKKLIYCKLCGTQESPASMTNLIHMPSGTKSTNATLKLLQNGIRNCPKCKTPSPLQTVFSEIPHIISIIPRDYKQQKPTKMLNVLLCNNKEQNLSLRGIVYWQDQNHFVSRIVTPDSMVWFHDGISTGRNCSYEGQLTQIKDMTEWNGHQAVAYIYAKP